MRILLTGAGGMLGRAVHAAFESGPGREVVAADRARLDVTRRDLVLAAITELRPDAIVSCAAWTDVDGCEADADRAMAVNGLAVRYLAEGAARVGATLCQLSTDFVFDGTKPEPYDEWDAPAPLSAYGRSKWVGELEAGPSALVVRTSWLNGLTSGLVPTILRLARSGTEMRFATDVRAHPTFVDDLAVALVELVVARWTGLVHLTNQRAVSAYELAVEVVTAAGLDPGVVTPVTAAELPSRPAARPANSVLDNAALRMAGHPLPPVHDEALTRLVKEVLDQ